MSHNALSSLPRSFSFAELLELSIAPSAVLTPSIVLPSATSVYANQFIVGTSASQTLVATSAKPYVAGMGGNDTVNGDSGDNILVGDDFDPLMLDYLIDDKGTLPDYDESVVGSDELNGGGGDDILITDGGNDTAFGGAGRDAIVVSAANIGASAYYGGDGQEDDVYFLDIFELGYSKVTASTLKFDASHEIESVFFEGVGLRGTSGNDVFDFSGTSVRFLNSDGYSINPVIDMAAGNDRFVGNSLELDFPDKYNLFGNQGNDTLLGGIDQDTLDGGAGVDSLVGGSGGDVYIVDNVQDIIKEAKVAVDGYLEGDGDTVQTTLSQFTLLNNIENLTYIGTGTFAGVGNSAANSLTGGAKADQLDGAGGKDSVSGGLGADILTGGASKDVFVFNTTLGNGNFDTVTDFNVADDTFWLKKSGDGLFNAMAIGTLAADKFLTYGTGTIDGNDRILYDSSTGKIYYDTDGSGAAARVYFASVTAGTLLTFSDFVVI